MCLSRSLSLSLSLSLSFNSLLALRRSAPGARGPHARSLPKEAGKEGEEFNPRRTEGKERRSRKEEEKELREKSLSSRSVLEASAEFSRRTCDREVAPEDAGAGYIEASETGKK